jgi:hypothetical protein
MTMGSGPKTLNTSPPGWREWRNGHEPDSLEAGSTWPGGGDDRVPASGRVRDSAGVDSGAPAWSSTVPLSYLPLRNPGETLVDWRSGSTRSSSPGLSLAQYPPLPETRGGHETLPQVQPVLRGRAVALPQ